MDYDLTKGVNDHMAKVSFVMGNRANLPVAYVPGRILLAQDERSWYVDISDSQRIRIGDFQEVANIAALTSIQNPSTTALYYATAENVLAKYNGTDFVQINPDTGATSIEVVGDGNAVTVASYDAESRKLTLTKGTTFAVPADITTAVGELGDKEEGVPYSNVKDYVDTKIADVVAGSISGLGDLASKDKVAETDLDTTLAEKINAKADTTYVDGKIAALDKEDTAVSGQVVSAVSEADGVITVERRALVVADIPEIGQDKVTGLTSALAGKQDTVVFNTTYNAETNKAATMADVTDAVAGLSGAMHYVGESTTDPAEGTATVEGHEEWNAGDVVTYNAKEYVYDGEAWRELGDESSFAVKGSIKNADIAADAAIEQSKIAGLTDALAGKATPQNITDAIGALDKEDSPVANQVVTGVSETDGIITVTRRALAADDIPELATTKITGLDTALAEKATATDLDALEALVGETAVATQITNAIGAMDNNDSAVANQFVTAAVQTDGKVVVSRAQPAVADVSGLTDALSAAETNAKSYADGLADNYDAAGSADAAETAAKEYTDSALTWGTF